MPQEWPKKWQKDDKKRKKKKEKKKKKERKDASSMSTRDNGKSMMQIQQWECDTIPIRDVSFLCAVGS